MPIRDSLQRGDVPTEAELRGELEAELRHAKEEGEPLIVIERPNPSTTHLFVIWSKFDGLEQVVRSRLILDAYEAVRGQSEALKVTVSMGLTQPEADRMGIKVA
jgi:hypothetical protein